MTINISGSRLALRPIQPLAIGYQGLISWGRKLWCEVDHSPPSSDKFKNPWSYTPTPQSSFMEWFLIKHRHNFTFTLTECVLLYESYVKCGSVNFWGVGWGGGRNFHKVINGKSIGSLLDENPVMRCVGTEEIFNEIQNRRGQYLCLNLSNMTFICGVV
jgi:hypothetical protein